MVDNEVSTKSEYQLYVRRYAPFASFGGGFEGDNRSFSMDLKVTSRTVGVATFGPKPSSLSGSGYSSGSSYVGPWEVRNNVLSFGSIGHHEGQVNAVVTDSRFGDGTVSFTLYTEGNLPIKDIMLHKTIASAIDDLNQWARPGSRNLQGSPDIDTFIDLQATFNNGKIEFKGTMRGDGFPNAEVFVVDGKHQAVGLLDYRTSSGEAGPLYRLFGAGKGNQVATFEREVEIDKFGSFKGDFNIPPKAFQET